jgi:hypothetical protein
MTLPRAWRAIEATLAGDLGLGEQLVAPGNPVAERQALPEAAPLASIHRSEREAGVVGG